MIFYIWNKLLKKCRGKAIRNSKIHKTSKIEAGSQSINTTMDRYSFCGYDCKLLNCSIGSFTSISDNVVIGGAQHPMEWVSMSPVFYAGRDSVKKKFSLHNRDTDLKTIIGNDVWIGERVLIKGGTIIGDGAVVGMGSVVTHDIPPYEIWAGNPARFIRKRFSEEIIAELQNIRWWDWEDTLISKYADVFNTPQLFISKVHEDERRTK